MKIYKTVNYTVSSYGGLILKIDKPLTSDLLKNIEMDKHTCNSQQLSVDKCSYVHMHCRS